MKILKDHILLRTKANNLPQLFKFLTEDLNQYYIGRLTHAAIGNHPRFQRSRFLAKDKAVKADDVTKVFFLFFKHSHEECGVL